MKTTEKGEAGVCISYRDNVGEREQGGWEEVGSGGRERGEETAAGIGMEDILQIKTRTRDERLK